jgi:hypothetical protein
MFLRIRSPKKEFKNFSDLVKSAVYCNVSGNGLAEELDKLDRNFSKVS